MTICGANCATCRWETLTMLNPQLVAGEHGLFGGHESKEIQTIFNGIFVLLRIFFKFNCFLKSQKI